MKPVKDALGSRRYCSSIYDWTSGFFPGNLWYAYQLTGIEDLNQIGTKPDETLGLMKLIKYRQECTLLQFKRMNQLMHIYYSQPVGYKVCNKLLDLNLFLPDSTQRGIIVEIKYIMHSILYHLDGRTWETFQKEIAAN